MKKIHRFFTTFHHSPLRRHAVLHASGLLLALGSGFLPASISQHAATSYDIIVTAKVAAAIPSQPAIITSPLDQEHFSQETINVSGTCPDNSYVVISRDGNATATTFCNSGTFSAVLVLKPGTNTLQAQVYNLTDDPGPGSPSITVYYDKTTIPPVTPPVAPGALSLLTVDGAQYKPGTTPRTSVRPTFTGLAPPGSIVTITAGGTTACITRANNDGFWLCAFAAPLKQGRHIIGFSAVTPDSRTMSFGPIAISAGTAAPLPEIPGQPGMPGFNLELVNYRYKVHKIDELWLWDIAVSGGSAPYRITIDWGDGSAETIERPRSGQFVISHAYKKAGTYQPYIIATDAKDAKDSLQLLAEVQEDSPLLVTTTSVNPWFIWPLYIGLICLLIMLWVHELHRSHKQRPRHA